VTGLAVIGSTGSIGRQTLDVVRSLPDRFRVIGLAAGNNVTVLEEQLREFRPRLVSVQREQDYLRERIRQDGLRCEWATAEEIASHPDVDVVMVGTVGKAGLMATMAALKAGKAVALANKEVLVIAGHLVNREARLSGASLRPTDSEHSAIWQCLWGEETPAIERIILTASGGPFRDRPLNELAGVTAEEALRHPNWQMGRKITVDSATLLNKGLECIEARWLFDVPLEKVSVVLHRESIVHSLVEFVDGSMKAQLGVPDMRLPIQCALTYPDRVPNATVPRLDLAQVGALNFSPIDFRRYPCLSLALQAGEQGGTYPTILSAVDEVAVQHFLSGHVGFTDIPRMLEEALDRHQSRPEPTLEDILDVDERARDWAEDWVKAKT